MTGSLLPPLVSREDEPEPEIAEELGIVEVEERVGKGFVEGLRMLLDRRRMPARALVEALRSEAAAHGADPVVGVRLESEETREGLQVRLRGRAVRLGGDEQRTPPGD